MALPNVMAKSEKMEASAVFDRIRGGVIRKSWSETDKNRYLSLLNLAARSPYAGERANAMAAAERLAQRHGMSLEEAARAGVHGTPQRKPEPGVFHEPWPPQASQQFNHHSEDAINRAKSARDASLAAARARGLDRAERRSNKRATGPAWYSRARRSPDSHAQALLRETRLSFHEISDLTGLDIYQVVGMKLKMRGVA